MARLEKLEVGSGTHVNTKICVYELGGKDMAAQGCFYFLLFLLLQPFKSDSANHNGVFKSLSMMPHHIA